MNDHARCAPVLGRRRVLQAGLAGLAMAVGGSTLVACATSSTSQAGGELDVLRIGVADLPSTLDPTKNVGNSSVRVFYSVFETALLADQAANYKLEPMLARSWKRVDGQTVDLQLAPDVKFHDGSPVTAADVKYSFDRLTRKIKGTELAASLLATIQGVQVLDDHSVRVRAVAVDPILEQRIASSWGGWILPMKYMESVGQAGFEKKPIGTGPYQLDTYSPERLTLNRFDGYWGEKPKAKRVEYILYPETSARITALVNGEVDIITQLPLDQLSVVQQNPALRVDSVVLSNMHVLRYNTTAPGLTDAKLRQALNLAIDRNLLIKTLWGGKAVLPKGHQFTEYGDMYLDDYPTPAFDPQRAKQLVAESTYAGQELSYELQSGYYTFGNEAAQAIVGMWKDIGVNARIKFTDDVKTTNVSAWSNSMRFPDPLGGLWLLWGPGSTTEFWPGDDEFNRIGTSLASTTDLTQRRDLERQLMQRWEVVAPGTILYNPYECWGIRAGLTWKPYSSQAMDFRPVNFTISA